MYTKVRKNSWAKFCREFNQANQFRHVTVRIEDDPMYHVKTVASSIFLGLLVAKQGRRITKISLCSGSSCLDRNVEPMASVNQPVSVSITKDETGVDDCLKIVAEDGMTVSLSLEGKQDPQLCHTLMKEIAHSIYERRGGSHGNDVEDWLEAENMITDVKHEFA